MEKVLKLYNDSPEIDAAAIVITKNLVLEMFNKLRDTNTYKFILDEPDVKLIHSSLINYN